MAFGILPHQLVDCTLREFLFDLNILTKDEERDPEAIKKEMEETIRRWEEKHKK